MGNHTDNGSNRNRYLGSLNFTCLPADESAEDLSMASTATRFSIPVRTAVAPAVRNARRRVTPEAGRALEKLGHAIEYLTDEIMHRGDPVTTDSSDVQAVQILMA